MGHPGLHHTGDFIIEGVDRVLVELSDHVIVFYNELITLMNAARSFVVTHLEGEV